MRTHEEVLERAVCAEHCRLFKPWDERQKCAAFAWLRDRVTPGSPAFRVVERLRGAPLRWRNQHDALLLRAVCIRCELYPYRCPFRRPDKSEGASPCGALLVMETLVDRRAVRGDELFAGPRTGLGGC
ncbi:MAG: hypothetical protein GXP50_08580 [Deltaproteobacteria bacterium]|nr:hypothetical protein [Deltaproteobacteria bacterium]